MGNEGNMAAHSASMLLMKLLEGQDMYGYQLIQELERRSDKTFCLKAGTLYPLLHDLSQRGLVDAYEKTAESGRLRKYYALTGAGRAALQQKEEEWTAYSTAVNKVLAKGGASLAAY